MAPRLSSVLFMAAVASSSCGGGAGKAPSHEHGGPDDDSPADDGDEPSSVGGSSSRAGAPGVGGSGGIAPSTVDAGASQGGQPGGETSGGRGGERPAPSATLLPSNGKLRTVPTASGCLVRPTDLAFDPRAPGRLWVVNHGDHTVCIVMDARMAAPASERRVESSREHFMPRPMALAFGGEVTTFRIPGTFATANDSAGDGRPDDGLLWNGITLWSSSLDVFGRFKGPDGNSHLDMLHDSPLARGIAWEKDNIYWVFGAHLADITRYDFALDHDRGHSDHSDGSQWHYAAGMVKGKDGVPSHLAYNARSRTLYIADTGNRRVAKLDTTSGTLSPKRHTRPMDRPETRVDAVYENAKLDDVVPPSFGLVSPAGLELDGDVLYVSDNETGIVHAFDLDGRELGRFATGRPAGSIMGLAVGPDRKLYLVDHKAPAILVLE